MQTFRSRVRTVDSAHSRHPRKSRLKPKAKVKHRNPVALAFPYRRRTRRSSADESQVRCEVSQKCSRGDGSVKTALCLLRTPRLLLRPTDVSDSDAAFAIQSDWNVTRMLRMARYPPDREELTRWFAEHRREWFEAEAFRFAIELGGRFVGVVDIGEIGGGWGDLGYWLDSAAWGRGYASEAAGAVVRFAFDEIGLVGLRTGHAEDNPASGRVLTKLGFREIDNVQVWSRPRGAIIRQVRYQILEADRGRLRGGA